MLRVMPSQQAPSAAPAVMPTYRPSADQPAVARTQPAVTGRSGSTLHPWRGRWIVRV